MYSLGLTLLIYYLAVIAVFSVYGLYRYAQVWRFLRSGGLGSDPSPAGRFAMKPRVTVQLPMYNEHRVAERVIEAACVIDYPQDRLQIQVLDDSTDESASIAHHCCERMADRGHDVEYLHRTNRDGYKAGALGAGMASATGDFVLVFDADFVPPPGILNDTIDHFTDDAIGMVQTRWAHLNREDSLLTELQALSLDGHFIVEQTARSRAGRWFNFNGTAGIWRRRCIEEAGGWQGDTITEDTDLSYRAQLAGWKFRFLADVTCPAELPPTVGALISQQHRWNKGLFQSAIKLLPTILRSDAPLGTKIDAFFHLTSPVPYAAMFLLTLLVAPAFAIGLPSTGINAALALGLGITCLTLGSCAAGVYLVASQWALGRPIGRTILRLPALMAVGIGVSGLNTRAMGEAIMGRQSPFVRTPKFNGATKSVLDPHSGHWHRLPAGAFEIAMGLVMLVCLVLSFTEPSSLVGAPFILLFAAGYLTIGIAQLRGSIRDARGEPATVLMGSLES